MWLKRKIFDEEHDMFRRSFRAFVEDKILPFHEDWEKDGIVPKSVWTDAGELGFLCPCVPEAYGGAGVDFRYSMVVMEELAKAHASGVSFGLHSDIIAPYIVHYGSEEQKKRFLPGCVSGETILAIAMSEPNTGSDLAAIQTTAVKTDDGYVLNGQKTFISNGWLADLVIVAAKTDPKAQPAHAGVSLFLVESSREGFKRGKKLKKIGMKAQDTSELYFEDCLIPKENLLGDEGAGFYYLMQQLSQERLVVAVCAQAAAKQALEWTMEYTKERKAFGRSISRFQNTRFALAEIATEIALGEAFVDRVVEDLLEGQSPVVAASMAKWWVSEALKRNVDRCLQFFGGYGYMEEYPIAKAYLDARVQTIYAGTTEIMKEIISRNMDL